jgi:multiple sugar transport system ATP-binding protein
MTLADRIVLLKDGLIEQAGKPLDLFERPATKFVAGFLGSPQMNFIPGELFNSGSGLAVRLDDGRSLILPRQGVPASPMGQKVILGLRPEHLGLASATPPRAGHARIPAAIDLVQPTGSRTYITILLGGIPVTAEVEPHEVGQAGEAIEIELDMNKAVLIDPATDKVI